MIEAVAVRKQWLLCLSTPLSPHVMPAATRWLLFVTHSLLAAQRLWRTAANIGLLRGVTAA